MNLALVRISLRSARSEPWRFMGTLAGGKDECLPVKPGPIDVAAAGKWPYPTEEREPRICTSNTLGMKVEAGKRVDVWISPRGDKNAYLCGWDVSTTEPPRSR